MAIVLETVNMANQANRLLEKSTSDNPEVRPPAKAYKGSGVSLNESFVKLLPSKLLALIQHCDTKQLLDKNKNDFDRFLESFETIANRIQELMLPCATIMEFLELNNASAAASRKAFQAKVPDNQRVRALRHDNEAVTREVQRKISQDYDEDLYDEDILEDQLVTHDDAHEEVHDSMAAVQFDPRVFKRSTSPVKPILKREDAAKVPCWMHLCDREGCTREGCQKDHSKEAMEKLYAEIGARLRSNRA
jgi:hypothetical protein